MIPTVAVTVTAFDQNGNPVSGGRVQAYLDRTEIYNGLILPERTEGVINDAGVCVLQLWPNALGVNGSSYLVRAYNPDTGLKYLDTKAVVPNNACRLEEIVVAEPFPSIDASGQALIAVQAALGLATSQRVLADESAAGATAAQQGAVAAADAAAASALASGASAQVAIEKAAQALEDAASALASKQAAESAAEVSGVFASNSNASAVASEVARLASVAAQGIAIEEAGKSFVSATESAESAAAAEAAKNQIVDKAEVNITTAGNILRADGTAFKSISEVEFLQNKDAFASSFVSEKRGNELVAFDNFTRPNGALVLSDNGLAYQSFTSVIVANQEIIGNTLRINSNETIFLPVVGSITAQVEMILSGSSNTSCYIVFGKDVNSHFQILLRSDIIVLSKVINGVTTTIIGTPVVIGVDANAFRLSSQNKVSVVNFSLFVNSVNNLFISVFYCHLPNAVLLANITNQIAGVTSSTDFTFFGLKGPQIGGKAVNSIRSIKIFQG